MFSSSIKLWKLLQTAWYEKYHVIVLN